MYRFTSGGSTMFVVDAGKFAALPATTLTASVAMFVKFALDSLESWMRMLMFFELAPVLWVVMSETVNFSLSGYGALLPRSIAPVLTVLAAFGSAMFATSELEASLRRR